MTDSEHQRFEYLRSSVYQNMVNEIRTDQEMVRGNYAGDIIPDEWADEGLQPTVPPTAYNAVVNAADHILSSPRTYVPPRPVNGSVEEARGIAEKQRKFHDMWWARVHEEYGDPLRRAIRKLILGRMVLKKTINFDYIPTLPDDPTQSDKRKFKRQMEKVARSKFIWKLEVIASESVFEDPASPWDPAYVYESAKVRIESLLRSYPDLKEKYGHGDQQHEVEYVEMWTKPSGSYAGEFVVWVDGERIHEAENPYSWESPISTEEDPIYDGYIPYVIADPGFGDVDAESRPEDRYISIIKPIRSVLISEARYLTELEAWLRMYVFPALITVNMDELEDGEKEFRLGPGTHLNIRPDQQVDILKWGEAPLTLMQGLQRVNNYADQAAKLSSMGGVPMVGVDTATEADQLFRSAATKLGGPISALQRACQRINSWVLMDIEHVLMTPVTLYGAFEYAPSEITLSNNEIKSYYYNNVTFETSDSSVINSRKARLWGDLYRIMPGLSERTAMDKMGVQDPTFEQEERAVEDMLRSSPIQQATLLMALAGLGEPGAIVRQALESNIARTTPPPPPPPPPVEGQPQLTAGDQYAMTTVDETGTPVDPVMNEARAQAMQQAPERQFF
mgnify:FL=1